MKKDIKVLFKNQSDYEFFYRNNNFCIELVKNFKNTKFINLEKKVIYNINNKYKGHFLNIPKIKNLKNYFKLYQNSICIIFL